MSAQQTKEIFQTLDKNLSSQGADLVEKVKVCHDDAPSLQLQTVAIASTIGASTQS